MTVPIHQDPDTGELRVNGKVGRFIAIWEFVGKLATPLLIPLLLYAFYHYSQHGQIRSFMDVGPRLTPHMQAEILRAWKLDILSEVAGKYPPEKWTNKIEQNRELLAGLQVDVGRLSVQVESNAKQLDRIELLIREGNSNGGGAWAVETSR